MIILTSISLLYAFALAGKSPDKPLLNYTNLGSGNPFVLGKFYDPASVYFPSSDLKDSGLYWVFAATNIDGPNDTSTPCITAFSSPDLADWETHENVLNMSSFPWANASVYSPSPVFSDGKYYLYFSATGHPHYEIESFNDLSQNSIGNYSGIGVGVSHSPEGPYNNVLEDGSPLIHADDMDTYSIPTSYKPYGPSVLIDRDPGGHQRVYMYYGIQGNLYVRELDKIPATFKNDSDLDSGLDSGAKVVANGTDYGGARVFKRGDRYYLLWNNGASSPPQIRYSRTRNPQGPFLASQDQQGGTLLQADPTVADNVYHADVLNIPSRGDGDDDDIWYLIYERMQSLPASYMSRNLDTHATAPINIRGLAYDRMTFGGEYNHPIINPVEMQVKDNFQRSSYGDKSSSIPFGWKLFGNNKGEAHLAHTDMGPSSQGENIISSLQLTCPNCQNTAVRLVMPTNFTTLQFTVGISLIAPVTHVSESSPGDWPTAGILFGGSPLTIRTSALPDSDYKSYYVGLNLDGDVTLGIIGESREFHELKTVKTGPDFRPDAWHFLRVKVDVETKMIAVMVDGMPPYKILRKQEDSWPQFGWTGLRTRGLAAANFTDLEITHDGKKEDGQKNHSNEPSPPAWFTPQDDLR